MNNLDYLAMGERVRKCRRARGMKQEELADQVGVSCSFIGHIERGEKKASAETIVSLCRALDISADYLLQGKENDCDRQKCSLYEEFAAMLARHGGREKTDSGNRSE